MKKIENMINNLTSQSQMNNLPSLNTKNVIANERNFLLTSNPFFSYNFFIELKNKETRKINEILSSAAADKQSLSVGLF